MQREQERQEAIDNLRERLKPGETVYTILRHVSRSGMLRVIDLVIVEDGQVRHIGYQAAQAMQDTYNTRHEGIRVSGCGMDMGFHLVYNLSATLYPAGFACIEAQGVRCPSNDHSNYRRGEECPANHKSGGYALRHRWL